MTDDNTTTETSNERANDDADDNTTMKVTTERAERAEESIVLKPRHQAKIGRVAQNVSEVDHFFATDDDLRAVERFAEGEAVRLVDVINEVGEIALQHDEGTERSEARDLRETLDAHYNRDTTQAVRVASRREGDDPSDVAKELFPKVDDETEAIDLSREANNQPRTTVTLDKNQLLMVTNALGEDAIDERRADRLANYRARWGLRQDLKEAAGIDNGGDDE
jgi:hypothetical protein